MIPMHRCNTRSTNACVIGEDEYKKAHDKIVNRAFRDGIKDGRNHIMDGTFDVDINRFQDSFELSMKRNIFGLYSICVYINHQPCTCIIDTGAQVSGLKAHKAKELGIRHTSGHLNIGSIGGTQKELAGLCADEFQIGAISFRQLPMIALGEHDFSLRFANKELLGFDGILGWDVLSQLDFELDDIAHVFKCVKNRFRFDHPNMIMGSFPVFLVRQQDHRIAVFGFDSGSKTSWIGKNAIEQFQYRTSGDVRGVGFGVHGMESLDVTLVSDVTYRLDRATIQLKQTMTGRTDIFPHFQFDGVFGNEIFRNRRIRLVNSCAMVLIA